MFREDNINNKPYLTEKRKSLRKRLTPAEAFLWRYLKNKQLCGKRFRRQFSVGNYILDFYCPEEKLAVELDGQGHFTPEGKEYDLARDTYLQQQGVKVLRFENKLVFDNLDEVLNEIKNSFKTPQSASSGQLP